MSAPVLNPQPAFQAGFRSVCALPIVLGFAWIMKKRLSISDGSLGPGVLAGLFFSVEFLLLFNALEFTTVSRALVLFYTMPVWVALAAHFLIPGEGLTARRVVGLVLAVVALVLGLFVIKPVLANSQSVEMPPLLPSTNDPIDRTDVSPTTALSGEIADSDINTDGGRAGKKMAARWHF